MDVLIVIDMQVGLLAGAPKHDLQGVVGRINGLAAALRARSGKVVWIRHCAAGKYGRGEPAWAFLPEMDVHADDIGVEKTLNDAFAGTALAARLNALNVDRSHGYGVVAVSDAHTLNDRPHLDAASVIRHHNWVWSELIAPRSVRVASTAELMEHL